MNSSWPKWFHASCAKHFYDQRNGVHLYVEGEDRRTNDLDEYAEFRINGPNIMEQSRSIYHVQADINILVTCIQHTTNAFRIHEIGGIFMAAFTDIPLLKLGSSASDTGEQFGCFRLVNRVRFANFGLIDISTRLLQGAVSGRYEVTLTAGD